MKLLPAVAVIIAIAAAGFSAGQRSEKVQKTSYRQTENETDKIR